MKQPRVVEYEHVDMHPAHLRAPEGTYNGCCYGAAFTDGDKCTCWEPVVEPQSNALQEGPMRVQSARCGDCAYRRDSPERQAIGGDTMPYIPEGRFLCHEGMARVTSYRHDAGYETDALTGEHADYRPPTNGWASWQRDGRPAIVCAGWAADNRAYLAALSRQAESTEPGDSGGKVNEKAPAMCPASGGTTHLTLEAEGG